MKPAEWLQEIKKMRFEEAYSGWTERRLTQEDAARLLGVCARTFRRYIDRYEENGLDGLVDKRLAQVSHRRAPVDEVLRLVDRYRRRHDGWSVKHYYAWYRRDGGTRSLQTGQRDPGCFAQSRSGGAGCALHQIPDEGRQVSGLPGLEWL